MQTSEKILVIIPAYNEEESIASVISDVRRYVPLADVLVVNDGSHDATAQIAEAEGAFVLNLPCNLGIGAAVQTGYKFAVEMGYDIAVQVDGDGQHPAEEIGKLIEPIDKLEADMTIGSRYIHDSEYKAPALRLIGMRVLSSIICVLIGQRVTDTSSGFRAANRKVLKLLSRMYPRDYPEPEAIVLLHRAGFKILEVPVCMRPRLGGTSSITTLKGFYYVVKVLLAIVIDLFKDDISVRRW